MKILLVEDSRAVAAVMAARLTSFGHEVTLAENGQVAFDKFRQSAPDLVLMDIEMPVMNGFEATHQIRAFESTQKWAWTPIIFLTASDSMENLIAAIEAGGDDFLVKGLSEEVLRAKMKAMARIAEMRRLLSIANLKLEQQASRDGLTGLFNRRWMDINVDLAWEQCVRNNAPFALLMLDVDNFKKYNDHYGHQAGDDCLRAIAHALESVVTEANAEGLTTDAFVARYGGEEFAVVMPWVSAAACQEMASRVVESVRMLRLQHAQNAEWGIVTVSVGGGRREALTGTPAMLFRDADAALYRAKESGRNRCELG
ncbi:MAG: two-component system cell cycle response regulator [Rhodocyclaceae bacterium]|nr:MAG: two-component system cell cycle response regulator [Rhodocyclaceae bacterium]TND02823.1 MAG: two-component system, cell cycle response regulator [Rhodocyclaceae bacterium]